MTYETLLFEQKDRIGLVTLNRPDRLNAVNQQMVREIPQLFAELKGRDDIGVVIITGAGERAFSAGADITEFEGVTLANAFGFIRGFQTATGAIEQFGKPVIAAVNGLALGGGCEIAISCTIRILSEKARMGLPEVNLGVIPGGGGTQRLPRLIGKGNALYYILTGEQMDAQEAYRVGLAQKLAPHEQLMEVTTKVANAMLSKGPLAIKMALLSAQTGLNMDMESGLIVEALAANIGLSSEDKVEGSKAFLEKRPPQFKGR
ncbi:MAG: enoyl-CoA hydratase-related protein [Dehalococcoidia bacterium]|nr:enoyl-CoA hydratase-related protein [Dehalococcoidia bacterium]